MNIIDAAYQTVHDYPGGSESLAPRIGMSPAVLRNKVNPNNDTHHLTVREANMIMAFTKDYRMLHALSAEHGFVLQKAEDAAEGTVFQLLLRANAAEGDLDKELNDALADGRLTQNELKRVLAKNMAQASAQMALMRKLCEIVEQGRA
ncbi:MULTISPECIES: phage regulatory CII family protein [Lysobacter]|uniref:Phage regulatory CII family protein n=1 Tax=Lysobacter auxotrophicus TaxID=2992573 RepID=A0ABM8DG14_9GAMM|nr:phage regulatory CII family protein [Lysobacter auxotrophicus]BDU17548.1 phage regulatory CII family protein [Lysobacter auxotrophicus]